MSGDQRSHLVLLDSAEQKALLTKAEQLWADLQKNDLGGYSGVNRPFYILHEFKCVIEEFGERDVGLHWSKNRLDARSEALKTVLLTTVGADLLGQATHSVEDIAQQLLDVLARQRDSE